MFKSLLIVGLGSFIGGVGRYYISSLIKNNCSQGFPWATLTVNLTGCLLFGVIYALFGKYNSTANSWCLLLTTGLCGGFTTFSTFANESMQMLQNNNLSGFMSYIATSLLLGIVLVGIGYWLVK